MNALPSAVEDEFSLGSQADEQVMKV